MTTPLGRPWSVALHKGVQCTPVRNIPPSKNFSMQKIRYDLRYSSLTIVVSPRLLAVLVVLSRYEHWNVPLGSGSNGIALARIGVRMITNQDYLSFHWHLYSHHTVWNDYGYLTTSQKRQLSKATNSIAPEDQLFILTLNLIRLVDQEGLSGRESSLWVYYFRIWLGIPAKQIDWTWFLAAATVDLERPDNPFSTPIKIPPPANSPCLLN